MGRCVRCGKDAWPRRRVCNECMDLWKKRRMAAFGQATAELGPLTAANHQAIVKRVKALEKQPREPGEDEHD